MSSQKQDSQRAGKKQVFYVGIDVHLRSWKVAIRRGGVQLHAFSMDPSPEQLVRYLRRHYPNGEFCSVYEAGFCGFWIDRELRRLGIHNIVVNAADVPTTQKEKDRKTDRLDCQKLASELENGRLNRVYVPDRFHEDRRGLCRLRYTLVRDQSRYKNRIKQFLYRKGVWIPGRFAKGRWSGSFLSWLEDLELKTPAAKLELEGLLGTLRFYRQEILKVTQQLRRISQEYGEIGETLKFLRSVQGVGFVTAISFYTHVIDIWRFPDDDHLRSFVGLVPSLHNSGERSRTGKMTKRSNTYLKYLLIEASWQAIRRDEELARSYQQWVQRMPAQQAIIRVARKLLSRLRYVWMNGCVLERQQVSA